MKEKFLALVNKLVDYIFAFVGKIVEVAYGLFVKVFEILFGFLDGIKTQISTAIGAIIFAVFLFLVGDVYKRGEFGVIGFLVTTIVNALNSVIAALQVTGAQIFWIVMVAMIAPVVVKLYKK
jgi:hypothetical protein